MLRFGTINWIALILLILLLALEVPLWGIALSLLVWSTLTIIGSFHIRWNYHVASLNSAYDTQENWVSITFDDGPDPEHTPKVLELLKRHGARATFFCIGEQIEKNAPLVHRILAEGHSLGNHTYSHSNFFGFFGTRKVKNELKKTNQLVYKITGKHLKMFRPAFGVTNPSIRKALSYINLRSIGWSVRSLDTTRLSEEKVFQRITKKLRKGDIILLHDTGQKSVAVLERLLVHLRERNVTSVCVDQLLEIEAYG